MSLCGPYRTTICASGAIDLLGTPSGHLKNFIRCFESVCHYPDLTGRLYAPPAPLTCSEHLPDTSKTSYDALNLYVTIRTLPDDYMRLRRHLLARNTFRTLQKLHMML